MKLLEENFSFELKEEFADGKWTMSLNNKTYSMYSIDMLLNSNSDVRFSENDIKTVLKRGKDIIADELLKDGEPDFNKVKNSIPSLGVDAYIILGSPTTWHNLTVGIETGEIFPHTNRIYDLPVPIFSPCMIDSELGRIKPRIFLLNGIVPVVFSVHTNRKNVLEFLYFVEAGDTCKEPVAYIRTKRYNTENPHKYDVSYCIASKSRTAPIRLIKEETFNGALENTVLYWSAFIRDGAQFELPLKTLEKVAKGNILTLANTFTGDHAHYGHRIYGEEFHDNFPPNYIWSLEATCLSGYNEWAKRIFRHMLEYVVAENGRLIYRQGEEELYGASAQEYGQLLFVINRYVNSFEYQKWSKRDWIKIKRLGDVILEHAVVCNEFENKRLIKMCAEADTNTRIHVYINNNLWGIRGLYALSEILLLGGYTNEAEFYKIQAEELLNNVQFLIKKYCEDSRFGTLPPFRLGYTAKPESLSICEDTYSVMSQEEKDAYFVASYMRDQGIQGQDLTENNYANYRYYPEMLSSMYLNKENAEAIIKLRENLGGEFMGMTRFMDHLDDWPVLHIARYYLETEKVDKYLLLLYAHTCHHGISELMCYYEQVLPGVKPILNDCVPSLLTTPIMSLWMFAYETVVNKRLSLLRAVPKAWFKEGFTVNNIGFSLGKIDISLKYNTLSVVFSESIPPETEIVWRAKSEVTLNDITDGEEYIESIKGNRIYLRSGIKKAVIAVRE